MSFLTEYFDEYRQYPIRKRSLCVPENRWAKFDGKWLNPKTGRHDKEWTDEETAAFVTETMRSVRGESTYYNDYCAHLDPIFKTRRFKPRPKKPCPPKPAEGAGDTRPSDATAVQVQQPKKLALKDTELMKMAHDLYEKEKEDTVTLEPLHTASRILGYRRPRNFKTGLTEYQQGIARVAYELVRDNRIPKYVAANGGRPRWGYPPEGTRQPELDGAPFEGERLY